MDLFTKYLELADKTDKAVESSEPGMLHHTFDQDPEVLFLALPSPS